MFYFPPDEPPVRDHSLAVTLLGLCPGFLCIFSFYFKLIKLEPFYDDGLLSGQRRKFRLSLYKCINNWYPANSADIKQLGGGGAVLSPVDQVRT